MTPDKQALLKKLLAQKGVAGPVTEPSSEEILCPRPQGEAPGMSFAQERLWFVQKLQPANTAYHLGQGFSLRGALDRAALGEALAELIRRHEALRTCFPEREGRGGLDVLLPEVIDASVLQEKDLTKLPAAEQTRELAVQQAEILEEPFDLAVAPLLRARLVRLGPDDYQLLFCVHHLVFDGWSIDVFTRELGLLYAAKGGDTELARPSLSYADYATWQRRRAQSPAWEASRDFWCNQLANTPRLILPTDRDRPEALSGRGAGHRFVVPAKLVAGLRELGQREGATLYMTLLAAWQVMLGRYAGQDDFAVGSPVANRPEAALEGMVGFFVNMIALRADLARESGFDVHLGKVVRATQAAFEHQEMPFEQIVERLRVPRDLSHHPVFQVGFTFQPEAAGSVQLAGVEFTPLAAPITAAKFDLLLVVEDRSKGDVSAMFEYSTDLFENSTIALMAENFLTLLVGISAAPGTAISRLPLVSDAERALWPAPPQPLPEAKGRQTLIEWFNTTADRYADRIAVSDGGTTVTYAELASKSDQVAWFLRSRGVGEGQLVAIAMERSVDVPMAILGILKSGGGYLPIDPAYPADRREFMLRNAETAFLLTDGKLREHMVAPDGVEVFAIDTDWAMIASAPAVELPLPEPEHTAYVIYTSGSTGRPKGVPITHRNVTRLFTQTDHWFKFGKEDVWALFHSFAFDLSVWEIWGAFLYGGRLVVVSFETSRSVDRFRDLLADEKVTVLTQTPSAFRQLVNHETELSNPAAFALRWIVFAGEALDLQVLAPWFDRYGDREPRLVNMYGITETTVHVTYREITAEDVKSNTGSVIGEPIPDLSIHLLDEHLQAVPRGVTGEIVVGGAGLARGYLKRPELTAERFVAHDLGVENGGHLYRSGDLARRLANADLEYLGRIDFQVKIRGFRVELGEIESALSRHPAISGSAVLAQRDKAGDTRLATWLTTRGSEVPDADSLRDHLLSFLPDYMVPASFTIVAALPLTSNGKIDRAALPSLSGQRAAAAIEHVTPTTDAERELAKVWADVLGIPEVGVTDNFFALGGDSIRSIEVRAAVRQRGWDFPLQDLFRHQTVRELAAAMSPRSEASATPAAGAFLLLSEEDRSKLPNDVIDAYPLAALQAGMVFHSELSAQSPVFHELFSYHLRITWDQAALREVLAEVVARHEILRTSVHPGGFSEPLQCVHAQAEILLTVEDLGSLNSDEQERVLEKWEEDDKAQGFAWNVAPLLRVTVHLRSAGTLQISVSMHHAILDGWSVTALLAEIFESYLDRLAGRSQMAAAPPPPFRDFVALEREILASEASHRFWTAQLDDPPAARFPRVMDRVTADGAHQDAVFRTWSADRTSGLTAMAAETEVSLKHLLLSAHAKVVAHLAGAREIVTGVISNGRPETEGSVNSLGLFLNTVPYRLDVAPGSWADLARSVLAADEVILPHRRYPLADLQKSSERAALFETSFNFVQFHVLDELRARSDIEVLDTRYFDQNTFDYFAQFSADSAAGTLELELRFNPAEFTREQVEAFVETYDRVFAAMVADAGARHETLMLLADDERSLLLERFNTASLPPVTFPQLHDGFLTRAVRSPDAVALIVGDDRLSYGDLAGRVHAWAERLRELGAGPEKLVGVCLERGVELVTAILAVLETGAAYVPLDPVYPADRLAFMCEDAQVGVLISRGALSARLPAGGWTLLDTAELAKLAPVRAAPVVEIDSANLAYLIYTSGSTGRPKATAIEHRQAVALVAWARQTYDETALAGVLFSTSVCFDLSIFELFVTLSAGGKVIMADNALALPTLPARDEVTLINTVPSAAAELVRQNAIPAGVKVVNLAGEPLSAALADELYGFETVEKVHDLYGPSEDTTYSTCALRARGGRATIGHVLPGSQLYLLDDDIQPVPLGTVGEIYLGGAGVARGYLGRSDLTAERFLPDPFSNVAGARFYRTGDLGRLGADGQVEFLGRRDHQVKIRGFRIELGEIKTVLEQHENVVEAVIVAREEATGSPRLVAYVTGTELPSGRALDEALRAWLGSRLPEHFVPSYFVPLAEIPLTPNGKLDRRALPAPPDAATLVGDDDYAAPRTANETALAKVWADVLKVPRVGIHDNYFALGGDSIQVLQLVSRAREVGLELAPRLIFTNPTVAKLALVVSVASPMPQPATENLKGALTLTPIQRWFFAQNFAEAHHWNQSVLLTVREPLEPEKLEQALRAIVAHHPMLRARFARNTDGIWGARIGAPAPTDFTFRVVSFAEPEDITRAGVVEQAALDLENGPLVRALWMDGGPAQASRLFIVIHHLVVDGVSWRVLLGDLLTAYHGRETFPSLTLSSSGWARWLTDGVARNTRENESAHWQALADAPPTRLPRDLSNGSNLVGDVEVLAVSLTAAETETLLRRALAAYGCQINDLLLAALALTLREWTEEEANTIHLEGHGREGAEAGIDLARSVGWFTSLYPIRIDLMGTASPVAVVDTVRTQLAAVPERGLGYGVGRWLSEPPRWDVPAADLCFNYLGQFDGLVGGDGPFGPADESVGPQNSPQGERAHVLDVNGLIVGGALKFEWHFSAKIHRRETVTKLADSYFGHLRTLLDAVTAGGVTADVEEETNVSRFELAGANDEDLDSAIEEIEF